MCLDIQYYGIGLYRAIGESKNTLYIYSMSMISTYMSRLYIFQAQAEILFRYYLLQIFPIEEVTFCWVYFIISPNPNYKY